LCQGLSSWTGCQFAAVFRADSYIPVRRGKLLASRTAVRGPIPRMPSKVSNPSVEVDGMSSFMCPPALALGPWRGMFPPLPCPGSAAHGWSSSPEVLLLPCQDTPRVFDPGPKTAADRRLSLVIAQANGDGPLQQGALDDVAVQEAGAHQGAQAECGFVQGVIACPHDLRVMSATGRVFVTHGVSETSRKTSVMQGTYAHLHAPHAVHVARRFSYI